MAGANIPEISDDLPEPDTPVIVVKQPSGIFTLAFFRLLCAAPLISSHFPFGFTLFLGVSILILPDR